MTTQDQKANAAFDEHLRSLKYGLRLSRAWKAYARELFLAGYHLAERAGEPVEGLFDETMSTLQYTSDRFASERHQKRHHGWKHSLFFPFRDGHLAGRIARLSEGA